MILDISNRTIQMIAVMIESSQTGLFKMITVIALLIQTTDSLKYHEKDHFNLGLPQVSKMKFSNKTIFKIKTQKSKKVCQKKSKIPYQNYTRPRSRIKYHLSKSISG